MILNQNMDFLMHQKNISLQTEILSFCNPKIFGGHPKVLGPEKGTLSADLALPSTSNVKDVKSSTSGTPSGYPPSTIVLSSDTEDMEPGSSIIPMLIRSGREHNLTGFHM